MAGFDELELVGEASSGKEAIRLCAELQPDIILMDMIMPDVGGAAATQAIRQGHTGHATPATDATEVLVKATHQRASQHDYGLTQRELEVLSLLVKGHSNAESAEQLVVSIATVKYHVRGMLSKLGVSSRTEAVALALQKDLIT